ncbi:DUF3592 domain-containing protein [Pseudomonas sp. Pseu.R1]|uniref:DUF3592 domain-containing protein n=1 Tax=Pseudomonas sp. Pseu.R1 TaxID=3379818 RepID=UPI003B960DF4
MNVILLILKWVFSIVGLGMLVMAVSSYKSDSEFLKGAASVVGVVEGFKTRVSEGVVYYQPVIKFAADSGEHSFVSSVGSNPAAYKKGESVNVLYKVHAPEEAKIDSFFSLWGDVVVEVLLGVVFFSIGAAMFLMGLLKRRKKAALMRRGASLCATITSVERNARFSVNGRHPYVITCEWTNPETYALHRFESEHIWFDPTVYVTQDKINVFVKPGNLKVYYVDISFLPPSAS